MARLLLNAGTATERACDTRTRGHLLESDLTINRELADNLGQFLYL